MPLRQSSRLIYLGAALAVLPARAGDRAAINYQDCMDLARANPLRALETALAWQDDNGEVAAGHCAAIALIELNQPGQAAQRLEELARRTDAGDPRQAIEILAQAGQAWLLAGETERALKVQGAALALDPGNSELLIDRSIALAEIGAYEQALGDLDRAAATTPDNAEVLVLRASALRRLGRMDAARTDIDRALILDPGNPEGLLERGILHSILGNRAGARSDWLEVLAGDPDSAAAEAARLQLEKLDVEVE